MKAADLLRRLRRRATRLGVEHEERTTKGSHLIVWHGGRSSAVAMHSKDMPIGTYHSILKQLGLKAADLED